MYSIKDEIIDTLVGLIWKTYFLDNLNAFPFLSEDVLWTKFLSEEPSIL